MTPFDKIYNWYYGRITQSRVIHGQPHIISINLQREYHWTADIARAVVGHFGKHWQWWVGTLLAVASLAIAWLAWRHPQPSPINLSPVASKNVSVADTPNESEANPQHLAIHEVPAVHFDLPASDSKKGETQKKE